MGDRSPQEDMGLRKEGERLEFLSGVIEGALNCLNNVGACREKSPRKFRQSLRTQCYRGEATPLLAGSQSPSPGMVYTTLK